MQTCSTQVSKSRRSVSSAVLWNKRKLNKGLKIRFPDGYLEQPSDVFNWSGFFNKSMQPSHTSDIAVKYKASLSKQLQLKQKEKENLERIRIRYLPSNLTS